MFDQESAEEAKNLNDLLFPMALFNSCCNPIVYGTYTINFRNELNRCYGRKKPNVTSFRRTTAGILFLLFDNFIFNFVNYLIFCM